MRREVKWGLLGLLGVLGLAIMSMSWFTVPEGFVSVVTRNGKVIAEAGPGLNWKVPFIDVAHDMSVQTQRVNFENVAAYSKDIQQATSYLTINYRLDASVVSTIYSQVGLHYDSVLLNARAFKHLKERFGKHNAIDIINNRDLVSNEVETSLAEDMAQFGIMVTDVQIANIDFSDAYEHAAEEAQVAKAAVVKAQQELERAKVETQKQIADADAKAKSVKLAADAEAYKLRTEGEAAAAAIAARGDALRNNPAYIELFALEQWKGQVPTSMIPGATVPFINLGQK